VRGEGSVIAARGLRMLMVPRKVCSVSMCYRTLEWAIIDVGGFFRGRVFARFLQWKVFMD